MGARDFIYDFVKKELIGPSCEKKDVDNEEIIVGTNPKTRYISGILFPKKQKVEEIDNDDGGEESSSSEDSVWNEEDDGDEETFIPSDLSDESEECLNLSNAFKQSAISLTFAICGNEGIDISVFSAQYTKIELDDGQVGFKRNPIKFHIGKGSFFLPRRTTPVSWEIEVNGSKTDLILYIFYRYTQSGKDVYTVSLVNNAISNDPFDFSKLYFQTELLISSSRFVKMPEKKRIITNKDYENNLLLFREEKKYAIGHGCSPIWEDKGAGLIEIRSSFLPTYQIDSIVPHKIEGVSFSMKYLYEESKDNIINNLNLLVEKYGEWIEERKKEADVLKEEYPISIENINNCLECNSRILKGIEILKNNETALKAFRYMNQAMLMQQLHYRIKKKEWDRNNTDVLLNNEPMPDIKDTSTWGSVEGMWRPFQIAFVLLNIKSIVEEDSPEHDNVELIWFPTGGGKTEAYLGLSAFTIFHRRLTNKNDIGTDIMMRYTLRLLTAQQYERASSLICSADQIRKENEKELGPCPISIGLWVGSQTTPNKGSDAVKELARISRGKTRENPFLITKCPWCGAEMGIIPVDSRRSQVTKGYYPSLNPTTRQPVFLYVCDNAECDFSDEARPLPLMIVDEQIYDNPPTMLIGTVDKFANLPFIPKAKRLFGIENGNRFKTVSLIIQDELHLISGPLGSTVALYETMIERLSSDFGDPNHPKRPKIVASTATISMAKTQCKDLFARNEDQIKIFPPTCLDNGETFFAEKDKSVPGRRYVGIYAPASSSQSTTSIRLLTSLLHAGARVTGSLSTKDAYWTNVVYFNSLRELGTAATWVNADIKEYSQTISKRIQDGVYRDNINYAELTSRIDGHDVSKYLDDLSVGLGDQNKRPIDICLATNMISVGLDITRLGLMTVAGQPKTTSEYIQTTSRVGRNRYLPGIIFTVYNPNKPRDKSVYENFVDYHSRMYSYVEPTSVTPFSPQLRKKALAAIFFGLIRLVYCKSDSESPEEILRNRPDVIDDVCAIILDRVNKIEPEEYQHVKDQLDSIKKNWFRTKFKLFTPVIMQYATSEPPCFYPNSLELVKPSWGPSYPIPTSMRSVDSECRMDIEDD